MKSAGLAIKEEPHTLRVPRSQRGGEVRAKCTSGVRHVQEKALHRDVAGIQVIEPLVSEQWFVKMESLAKPGACASQLRQQFASANTTHASTLSS